MVMQAQKKPRGHAWMLATKIAKTIDNENRKAKGRISVTAVLRALEWTRYSVTEQYVAVMGEPVPE